MAPFRNPVDIANRALQHVGQTRISDTLGFTEDSKQASETSFVYDKLRRAELQDNLWTFSTRKAVLRAVDDDTLILAPAMWSSVTTYFPGAIVSDEANVLWISNFPDNLNNAPGSSYFWDIYTGPLSVSKWDDDTAYFAGELVYTYTGDGTFKVYVSLENANDDDPAVGTAWDTTATYMKDQVVTYLTVPFLSLTDLNMGNTPSATPAAWAIGTTYAATNQVYGTDGYVYTSVGSGNVGHDPTTDAGVHWTNAGTLKPWTTSFTGGTGSKKWLQITPVALTDIFMIFPIGSGPSSQSSTRNIFRLPANYLRKAPQDPKAGSSSYLGAPSGLAYDDWNFEGDYLVSAQVDPIVFRFVADICDVSAMHDMFCEMLAARIGLAVCEPLTQSTSKLTAITNLYKHFGDRAKTTNGIEVGPVESPEDDFVTCRA